ncbi:hypothetical protein FTUN_2006 [Frigoriglobus tundricola]|uniref:Uncharacterized protein n=1 Tax=Frigoriglobus tundricola TaxID=2774151 RepID=A0A6M5YKL2_9BACT|nr:hypothetical protein FTUN_2006 [Frigoriglobus tundricola]
MFVARAFPPVYPEAPAGKPVPQTQKADRTHRTVYQGARPTRSRVT